MTPADTPAPMTDYRLEEISSEYKDYDSDVRLVRIGGTLLFGEFASMISELLRHRSSPSTAGGGWQAIETAPQSGVFIDLWHAKQGRVADCRWHRNRDGYEGWHAQQGGRAWNMMQSDGTHEFTHWRNRPEPPK